MSQKNHVLDVTLPLWNKKVIFYFSYKKHETNIKNEISLRERNKIVQIKN
jgi:hypothetical protein